MAFCESHCQRQQRRRLTTDIAGIASANDDDHSDRTLFSQSEPVEPLEITVITTSHCPGGSHLDDAPEEELSPTTTTSQRSSSSPTSITSTTTTTSRRRPLPVSSRRPRARHSSSWWSSGHLSTSIASTLLLLTLTTTVLANSVLNAAGDAKQEFGGGISHHASHQSSSSAAAASASAAAPSAIGIGVVTGGSSLASSSVSSSSSSSSSAEAAAASSAVISSDGSSSSSGKALAPAGSTPRRPRYRTLYACEGSSLEIACEEGTHINLIRANFGRFSISVCNEHGNVEWSVDCMSRRSFKVIEERCAGRSKCSLEATVASLGEDACPRVHKYLEVHFNCTAPGFRPSSPAVAGSLDSISSSSSDNHHHPDMIMGPSSGNPRSPSHHNPYQQHHHNHNHHHSTIPPLMLFPEPPSAPQPSSSASSGTTSSSPLQRPFLDFGVNGDKEKEEMENDNNNNNNNNNGNHHGSEAGTLIGPHFGHHEPPVVVRPPQPSPQDFSNNNNNNNGDDDSEDNGGGDEDDDEDQEKPISPYGSDREDSQPDNNNNHNHNNHHHKEQQPVIVVEPSMEPTAKPPKPPKDFPLGNDYNNHHQTFTSSPLNPADPSHGLLDPNSSSNENGIPVETATYVVMPPLDTLLYDHCHPMYAKGLNWNWTAAGQVAMQPCPEGAEGTSRWACTTDAGGVPTWTPALPDMSNCSSLWVTHLVGRLRSHKDSMFTMAEELAKGAKGKKMYSGDLIRAADIVKQLVSRLETYLEESLKEEDQERRANVIKELLNSVLNVASNLLEEIQMESWHELTAQDQRLAIGSMTGALESVATMLADVRSQPNYNYVRTHNNILVSVHVHSLAALEHGLRLPLVLTTGNSQHNEIPSPTLGDSAPTEVSAYLPYEALVEHANENGQVKIVFMIYRRLAGLLKPRHLSASYEAQNLQQAQPTGSPQAERSFMNSDREEPPVFVNPYQTANGRHNYRAAAQGSGHFPTPASSSSAVTIVNSDVVGLIIASDHHQISSSGSGRRASVYDRLSTPLSAPLELTLRHLTVDNVTNGRCAFWDIKRADWSTAGCQTVTSNRSHTVCRCNHLTNFAVLMDVANVPLSSGDEYALKMITRVGCAVSIVALTLTLITLSVYRSLKSIRNSIHKHLCACLLVAETIFLLGIDETRVKLLCGLIAIALHYFFLAAFLWMFFEGLQLYTMLVTVFDSHRPHRLTAYTLVAYGAPALLVIVAALVDPLSYGTSDHCWLRADNHFVWSFLGPALAVLLANALFLALAMSVMCRHGGSGGSGGSGSGMISASSAFAVHQKAMAQQQQSQLKVYPSPLTSSPSYSIAEHSRYTSIRVWVRTSFALVVVLGLTWTFGVLYLSTRSNLVMAYLFTVLNSLQGLFIFIACCLLNEKVRGEYRTTLARGARRCFFLRPFEGVFLGSSSGQGGISSSLAAGGFTTKSSTDSSTRSASMMVRDGMPHHHLMMGANGLHHPQLHQQPHHLSQQHLYMQQPAASYLGARNATGGGGGPATRTSLLYLNELLGGVKGGGGNGSQLQSETATAASTPTADQPLIGGGSSQLMGGGGQSMTPSHLSQAQSTIGLDQQQQNHHHNLNALQQSQLSAALAGLSQITLPGMTANGDDVSNSDYGCRRLTQMIEHIYECIDEDPYVAKLLLPAIERSLTNHQVRTAQQQQQSRINSNQNGQPLPSQILATLGRQSHRDISQHMRLQPNSSYLSSPGGHHQQQQQQQQQHHTLQHGAINSMHLPAIVRDNTLNGKMLHQQQQQNGFAGHHQHHQQQQQTVALLDGDTVRCCTLTDHKLCDHGSSGGHHQQQQQHSPPEMMMNGGGGGTGTLTAAHHMMKMAAAGGRHHLASEC